MTNVEFKSMSRDSLYLSTFLEPIVKCKSYKPKFGDSQRSDGYSFDDFIKLYSSDPFYSWIGLDSNLMYAAHKAAGGMTSVYRQVGIGCEYLFRQIICDVTGYTDPSFARWSYRTKTGAGKDKTLSLDGRLEITEIKVKKVEAQVVAWIKEYIRTLEGAKFPSNGVVFEIRQGYKSKDSKRQNADIDNATVGWAHGYLPVFAIFSSQIDGDIVLRYRNNRCGILTGIMSDNPIVSLYAFCDKVLGYDLADFFKRHSSHIQKQIHEVLDTLLKAE